MRTKYLNLLKEKGWISEVQLDAIRQHESIKPFSLHWELRTILYLSILLVTSGIGIIIYENIDTIGHTAIIIAIAAACTGCFIYCFKNKLPYSHTQVSAASPWFDYILLLGCLLFLALEGYLQFQYTIFGTRYGIATLIPAILFFYLAYAFDHKGVLSLAITALASFVGISASPGMLLNNQLSEANLIYTGIGLAALLIACSFYFKTRNIKRHFTFTYYNFGFNLLFICLLSACFTLSFPWIYLFLVLIAAFFLGRFAIIEKSFFFLLMAVIYSYIGITWLMFQTQAIEVFGLYYFALSCAGVIYFFINYKKILNIK